MNDVWRKTCEDRLADLVPGRLVFMTAAMLLYIVVAGNYTEMAQGKDLIIL
jgi:hypothetical protein